MFVGLVANGKVGMKDRCAHARAIARPALSLSPFPLAADQWGLRQHQQQPIFAHRYANILKLDIAVVEAVFTSFSKFDI